MRTAPYRPVRFRPNLQQLESRTQPGSVLPWLTASLPDAVGAGLAPPPVRHESARLLGLVDSTSENRHTSGEVSMIQSPSGDRVRERTASFTVTPRPAGSSPTLAQELLTLNVALGRQGGAGFTLSGRPFGGTVQQIPTEGVQPHVTAVPNAVTVQPMTFATVRHWDDGGQGIDQQVSLEWSTYVTGTDTSAAGRAVAVDAGSNAYVTGSVGEGDGQRAFVAKYTNTGRQIYYTEFQAVDPTPGFTYGSTEGHGIAVDPDGNAYVTGAATRLETGNRQAFAMKFDAFGNVVNGYGGGIARTPTSDASGEGIAVNAAGQATLTGSFQVSGTETEIFAVKFNPPGTLPVYAVGYQFPGFDNSTGLAAALDATADNVYLAGWIQATGSDRDILVMKVDNAGAMAGRHASYALSAMNPGDDALTGIAVMGDNAFVVGTVSDLGRSKPYAAEVTSAGDNFLFTQIYDGADSATALSIDSAGNSYFTGAATLDDGSVHALVAKVDSEGNPLDSVVIAGDTTETGAGIAVRNGNAFVTGTTSSTNLGSDGTTLNGNSDAFLVKATNFS